MFDWFGGKKEPHWTKTYLDGNYAPQDVRDRGGWENDVEALNHLANTGRVGGRVDGNTMYFDELSQMPKSEPASASAPASSSAPVDTTTTSSTPGDYVIQKGDTLWDLTGGDQEKIKELAALNNIKNVDLILAGATLKTPSMDYLNRQIGG